MAATVINSYADELENYVVSFERMEPTLSRCKLIVIPFQVTFASQAAGEDVALAVIPKGARLISGLVVASATLANSAQISIGLAGKDGSGFIDAAGSVSDDVAALKAAATQSTTQVSFLLTQALKYQYKTEKELWLTLTTSVGTVATELLTGHIIFAYPS